MRGPHFGSLRQRDRLLRGEMTAFRVVVPSVLEGALDEEEIGAPDRVLDRGRRSRVAGVGESSAVRSLDDHAPRRHVVAGLDEPQAQVADDQLGRGVVFDRIERRIEEPDPLADRGRQCVESSAAAGREVDR